MSDKKISEAGLGAAGFVARLILLDVSVTSDALHQLSTAYIQLAIEHDNLRRNQKFQHRIVGTA